LIEDAHQSDVAAKRADTRVQTVCGPVPLGALGPTLVHEHLVVHYEPVAYQWPHLTNERDVIAIAKRKVDAAMKHGIRTIVDPTAPGLGRNVRLLRQISEATGINVVASTGYYTQDRLPLSLRQVDQLVEAFTHDVEVGIQGTDSRAGFLKCATDRPGIVPDVEVVLRAVARVHRATGIPIMTHAFVGNESGLRQLEIFEEEGVDCRNVLIGHCGDTTSLGYLEAVARRGAVLGMDRYGLPRDTGGASLSTAERNRTVAAMVGLGYTGQLVLSNDAVGCYMPLQNLEFWDSWDFTYIFEHALPELRELGIDEAAVNAMIGANVHRWLQPVAAY
jgi:phosphotriesterase-related protein